MLAYLAGIADGEGYIGIKKEKARYHPGCTNPLYSERFAIRMADRHAIKLFEKVLGGWSYPEKQYSPTKRPCFVYEVCTKSAATVIRALLPFLRIKKPQAIAVLKLTTNKITAKKVRTNRICTSRWGTPMVSRARTKLSHRTLALRERLYLLCKRLNRTGPSHGK